MSDTLGSLFKNYPFDSPELKPGEQPVAPLPRPPAVELTPAPILGVPARIPLTPTPSLGVVDVIRPTPAPVLGVPEVPPSMPVPSLGVPEAAPFTLPPPLGVPGDLPEMGPPALSRPVEVGLAPAPVLGVPAEVALNLAPALGLPEAPPEMRPPPLGVPAAISTTPPPPLTTPAVIGFTPPPPLDSPDAVPFTPAPPPGVQDVVPFTPPPPPGVQAEVPMTYPTLGVTASVGFTPPPPLGTPASVGFATASIGLIAPDGRLPGSQPVPRLSVPYPPRFDQPETIGQFLARSVEELNEAMNVDVTSYGGIETPFGMAEFDTSLRRHSDGTFTAGVDFHVEENVERLKDNALRELNKQVNAGAQEAVDQVNRVIARAVTSITSLPATVEPSGPPVVVPVQGPVGGERPYATRDVGDSVVIPYEPGPEVPTGLMGYNNVALQRSARVMSKAGSISEFDRINLNRNYAIQEGEWKASDSNVPSDTKNAPQSQFDLKETPNSRSNLLHDERSASGRKVNESDLVTLNDAKLGGEKKHRDLSNLFGEQQIASFSDFDDPLVKSFMSDGATVATAGGAADPALEKSRGFYRVKTSPGGNEPVGGPTDDEAYVPVVFTDLRKLGNNEYRSVYFRPYLTTLSEDFAPNWNLQNYFGRVDPVATYQSTNRSITLGFKLVAFSPEDLRSIYQKLTWLTSMVYPQFNAGMEYKAGPVIRLRVGDVINALGRDGNRGLSGVITNLSLGYDDATWELQKDRKVPRSVDVSVAFQVLHDKPIGTYRTLGDNGKTDVFFGGLGWEKVDGKSKFIASSKAFRDSFGGDFYNDSKLAHESPIEVESDSEAEDVVTR